MGIEPIELWEWIAIYSFLSRSWFRRSWVVQEATLSQELSFCCGALLPFTLDNIGPVAKLLVTFNWNTSINQFAEALQGCSGSYREEIKKIKTQRPGISLYRPNPDDESNPSMLRLVFSLRIGFLGFESPIYSSTEFGQAPGGLSRVLKMFRHQRATDPRDKVYAFFALAQELGQVEIPLPDYEKSVAKVFQETMQCLLQSRNSLNDLSMKEDPQHTTIPNLKSWVPDFTHIDNTSLRYHQLLSAWSAGERLGKTHIGFLPGGILEARGLCIGTVRVVHDLPGLNDLGVSDGQKSLLDLVKALPEYSKVWVPCLTPSVRSYLQVVEWVPNKEIYHQAIIEEEGILERQSRLEVFWRTLVADQFGKEFPSSKSTVELLLRWWRKALQMRMVAAGVCTDPRSPVGQELASLSRCEGGIPNWDALRSSISETHCAQVFLQGLQSDELQGEAFPEEVAAILPELDSAWAEGRASAEGQAMAKRVIKDLLRPLSVEESEFEIRVESHCQWKRLFATNEGQLGLGPNSVREGDEVWILAGADVPFLFRRRRDGRYTLLGDAYVHGAMFTERHQGGSNLAVEDVNTILIV